MKFATLKFWRWGKRKEAEPKELSIENNVVMTELLDRPNLTRDAFFLLYARLIEERFGARNLRFDEIDVLRYEDRSGTEMTAFMQNAWLQCEQGDEPRSVILDRYLAVIDASVGTIPATRDQVIAIVKDASYVSFLEKGKTVKPDHLAADLWAVYAVDLPQATQTLSQDVMDALGLRRADLRSLAVKNLRRLLSEIEYIGDGPWFMVSAGPDYSASLLLLDEVWDEIDERVEGDVVVVVPARDVVLCTGSDSQEGMKAIRHHAAQVVKKGHHIVSGTLLRRVEERWVNFD